MSELDKIERQENGASFKRADLHIHSYGFEDGSYDVKDESMTPEAIVDLAIKENLEVVSITDHNEIQNSIKAFKYAVEKNILVLLGIEVSTVNGHLLSYFPTIEKLKKFPASLNIGYFGAHCATHFGHVVPVVSVVIVPVSADDCPVISAAIVPLSIMRTLPPNIIWQGNQSTLWIYDNSFN